MRPTAAPARFPYREHRTMAQVDRGELISEDLAQLGHDRSAGALTDAVAMAKTSERFALAVLRERGGGQ